MVLYKNPVKFEISAYKLIRMSKGIIAKRAPYKLQKTLLPGSANTVYFVWNNTFYNDEKLVGTRLITHYYVCRRSVIFE